MKRLVTILLGVVFPMISSAVAPDKRLVIASGDGASGYAVKSIRSLKFCNGTMLLNMHDGSVVECDTESVNYLFIEDYVPSEETGIGCIETEPVITLENGVLSITGYAVNNVLLSTPSGSVLYNGKLNGTGVLDLSRYPHGVYMLNVNGRTYKIINR